jgi:hypothetical protein
MWHVSCLSPWHLSPVCCHLHAWVGAVACKEKLIEPQSYCVFCRLAFFPVITKIDLFLCVILVALSKMVRLILLLACMMFVVHCPVP